MTLLSLGLVWAVAIAVSLAVTGLVAVAGLGDVPDGRSSHSRTTPTAGGLGIMAGLGAAFLLPVASGSEVEPLAALLALVFAVGVLGLQDDVFVLGPKRKFVAMLAVAGLAVAVVGPVEVLPTLGGGISLPPWLGFAGAVLWIFVVMNAVNFIDGINGIMAGTLNAAAMGVAGIAGAMGAPTASVLAVALSGALLGFLPYNFRTRARVFAGDTGALVAGFVFALLPLLMVREAAPDALYVAPVLILPVLADVLMTLVRRARRGERLLAPHRGHLYQIAARRFGHVAVASVYLGLVLPLTLGVLGLIAAGWESSLGVLLALAVVSGVTVLCLAHLWDDRA